MSDQETNNPRDIALREETGSNNMPLIGLVAACAIGSAFQELDGSVQYTNGNWVGEIISC